MRRRGCIKAVVVSPLVLKSPKIYTPMMLNGDNRKIFVKGDVIYRVGEHSVSEHSRETLGEIRRRGFYKARCMKEYGGRYYFYTGRSMRVHEDVFGEAVEETEMPHSNVFDFHVYDGRIFYVGRRMNRYLGFDDKQELMFDFQAGCHFWEGACFYVYHSGDIVRFDLIKKTCESVVCGVRARRFVVKEGVIVYTDDANIVHFVNKGTRLSYHYHALPVMGMIVTGLGSLFVVCKDRKLVRLETRRNERTVLSEFHGDVVDFTQDERYVYVLTTFSLHVYDTRAGSGRDMFSLPDFESCKPLCMAGSREEASDAGREIFEKNVKRTRAKLPYVFEKEEGGRISADSVVVVRGEYVFIYDVVDREVQRVGCFRHSECFYSSGHIITFARRGQRRTTIKIYRIDEDGVSLVRREEVAGVGGTPEDVVLDGGRMFLYQNGRLVEVTMVGGLSPLRNEGVRQIEETCDGVYVLDTRGIFRIACGEWVLEDSGVTSFRVEDGVLYVSSLEEGVVGFAMRDGAVEERLVDDINVVGIFVRDNTMMTSSLEGNAVVLKRYTRNGDRWTECGRTVVSRGVSRMLGDNMYLSVRNRLHEVSF